MKAYSYDNNGLYQGEVERQYDELDKIWLMPAGATDIPLPKDIPAGKVAVFDETKWELKDDNSGTYYRTDNKQQIIINYPLDLITGLTKLVPPLKIYYEWNGSAWVVNISKAKELKEIEISNAFDNAMGTSHFMSTALGIEIDCRRSSTKNDLQNIKSLISKMERENWTSIEYVGYTETKAVTKDNLEAMVIEMEDFVLGLYQHKWILWNTIQAATTLAQIEEILW